MIVGTLDPNPLVSGQGVEQLRAAGIEVIVDVEAQETRELIRPFATFITRGRPYVTAKWAMTLDGKSATRTGDANWISGPEARVWVHNLRDRVDAILVGAGTVRADDPMLNVRLSDEQRFHKRLPRQGPLRVVLATQGQLSNQYKLLRLILLSVPVSSWVNPVPTSSVNACRDIVRMSFRLRETKVVSSILLKSCKY